MHQTPLFTTSGKLNLKAHKTQVQVPLKAFFATERVEMVRRDAALPSNSAVEKRSKVHETKQASSLRSDNCLTIYQILRDTFYRMSVDKIREGGQIKGWSRVGQGGVQWGDAG